MCSCIQVCTQEGRGRNSTKSSVLLNSSLVQGLKMRQLKRACLLKLQEMCEEEILSVIQPGGPTPEPTLDSTLMGILGQSSTGTSRDRDFQPVTPVNEDAQSSTPENKDVTNDKAETGTGATPVCLSNRATAERESVADRHLETRCSHQECVRDVWDKEIVMSTSDVSEDECDDKDSKPSMELVVTGAVALPCGSSLTTGFEHGAETPSVNPNNLDATCSSLVNTNSDPSKQPGFKIDLSNNDKEEPAKDVPQAGQLLEMEMRRRALESALRQVKEPTADHAPTADHTPSDNESQVYSRHGCESLTQPVSEGDKNKLVITSPDSKELLGDNNEEVPVHYRQDGSSPTEEVVVECVTPEESSDSQQLLVERRLREKLLRSLVDHK